MLAIYNVDTFYQSLNSETKCLRNCKVNYCPQYIKLYAT